MTDRPYAVAAPRYLEHGWHPLPVPWGKKGPPPLGDDWTRRAPAHH